jgi:hypothetical protein
MEDKKIKMLKNGEWVKWDGSDVSQLLVEEKLTLKEVKKYYPEVYKKAFYKGIIWK